ncbi:uncharacterized protein [Battus philenor]|uniref:uncharacterized protein n=1 Tax=Battus philenor TaxID=42288 RepID=UPI0035D0BD24
MNRRYGIPTSRTLQVLSGYGCFGKYLSRIGREPSTICQHCGSEEDTAQHTLEERTAWGELRLELADTVGNDLSLPGFVKAMIQNEQEQCWYNLLRKSYVAQGDCGEREREKTSELSLRSRKPGRRRVFRAFFL